MDTQADQFWKLKKLEDMPKEEWEALCDGCGKCCLVKLEDEEDSNIYYTSVHCRYLEEATCRCQCYTERTSLVPDCVWLTPAGAREYHWLPKSCAYRLVAEGKDLPWWHHLVSGDRQTIHKAGMSIIGRSVSEDFVHPEGYDEYVIKWVEY